jgi:hemoglobin-like flavoprotein
MPSPTNPDLMMTAEQRRLVRDSFELLQDYGDSFTLLFYGKLFELDPSARKLFHNDLAKQGRKLMDMLAAVVESLEDFRAMQARLSDLGRKHTEYGVRPEQYKTLTEALLWAISQPLGAEFDVRTRAAWRVAIQSVCTLMQLDQK